MTLIPSFRPALSLALGLSLLIASNGAFADAFVRIDGIEGESADKAHPSWIDATDVSYAMKMPSAAATGSSRRRGAATFEPITIRKRVDKASAKLQDALARGRSIPKVTIELTRGQKSAVYYRVELTNVQIVSYQLNNSGRDAVEEIAISYEQIMVSYSELDPRGTPKGSVQFQWNVSANK